LLATAVVWLLRRDPEPHYNGRSLYQWLVFYQEHAERQDLPEVQQATHAINSIGTNAFPFLMQLIQQEPPPWQSSVRGTLPRFSWDTPPGRLLINGTGKDRADRAMLGFILLATNAVSAIPELAIMINDTNHPATSQRAMTALSKLGLP